MLRAVFIGSDNPFNRLLVEWLTARVDLAGVVWIQATAWQRSWKGRWGFAQRRLRRHGAVKMLDETLFFLYYHGMLRQRDEADLRRNIIQPESQRQGDPVWQGESLVANGVNAPAVHEFLRESHCDLAFAMCINSYFKRRLRKLCRHGIFLWHEGVTPEYKGLYSPFWAVSNLDFDRLGYTLLRMNARFDAGQIFVQGKVRDVDPFRHLHGYVGHKAIWDSLPAVAKFLGELESGVEQPIERPEAQSGYYTYPGLSDWIRQRRRLRGLRRRSAAAPFGAESE